MKLKLIILIALSTIICISSCKKDSSSTDDGVNNRAVILRMDFPRQGSRASIEGSITSTVVEGFQRVDVYLYNKSTFVIYSIKTLSDAELTAAASNDGLQITNLNSNVDAIVIICNDTGAKDLNVTDTENMTTLFSKPLDISLEQVFDNLTYTGKNDNLVQVPTPTGGSDEINYYNASVTISPLVARIELSEIICSDKGDSFTPWQNLILKSVFVDQVYSEDIKLNYLDSTPTDVDLLDATADQVTGTTPYWWLEILEAPNDNADLGKSAWSPKYATLQVDGVFAFHVFEKDTPPMLGLYIGATNSTLSDVDRYVRFDTYTGPSGNISSFEVGKIYRIQPTFIEGKVSTFQDVPTDITLTITVQEWTIVDNIIAGSR